MKKIGKQGKINEKANREIDRILDSKGIMYCEIGLSGCTGTWGLTRAHRHKRIFYRSQPEKLWDFKQFALCCMSCHEQIERWAELTEEVFQRLRGDE
jgi:hypothetical protein